jgi:hypothetical protein
MGGGLLKNIKVDFLKKSNKKIGLPFENPI